MPIYFASVRSRRQALLCVTNEWPLVAPSEFRRGQKARYALLEVVSCCEPRHFPLPRSGLSIPRAMAMVRHWLPFARSGNDRSGAHRNRCDRSSAGHPSTWLNGVALCITKLAANVRVRSMLSKKSFGGDKRNFLKLLMHFVRSDVRDHIASQKNDHGPSYRH